MPISLTGASRAGLALACSATIAAGCSTLPTGPNPNRTTGPATSANAGIQVAAEPRVVDVDSVEPWARTDVAVAAGGDAVPVVSTTRSEPPAPSAPPEPARPPEPVDLVGRIRAGFVLPDVDDAAITRERDWYAAHPDYIERVFTRAGAYLYYIAGAIEARGMPLDLALLPIVESAYDPFAYSHGRASGLWQIIPGTGRRLGLKQNWWFDGRRDIPESTRAALDYLEQLHDQFDGDWLLAIAGYNSGEGNVARAVAKARAAGRPTDFWSIRRDLPVETRTYVPKLIAIRDLVAAPESFRLEIPEVPDQPAFVAVDVGSQIDMALAAELADIDVASLYTLNPGINRWATDPDGPYRLLVPPASGPTLTAALATLPADARVSWTRYRIKTGETLGQIAMAFDTTPALLRESNGLHGNLIRAGDYLMIPHRSAAEAVYSQSLDARVDRQRNRERPGNRLVHTVEAGESLWSIAGQFRVGVRDLAAWNAMAPGDTLPIGRELVVWTNADVAQPLAGAQLIRRIDYVVRRGDSLAAIAQRFRVTVAELVRWNKIDPKRYLQPGQHLVMHVDVTEQSS